MTKPKDNGPDISGDFKKAYYCKRLEADYTSSLQATGDLNP
jgi:hypothetical protein